jgi:hypothetical protein
MFCLKLKIDCLSISHGEGGEGIIKVFYLMLLASSCITWQRLCAVVKNDLDLSGSPTTAVTRAPFRDDFVSPSSLAF